MVPLAEGGATVGTPSLTQCKAEQDAQREEENGAKDPETGEVILQDAHSAGRTSSHHHYRRLYDGVRSGIGLLGDSWAHLGWSVSLAILVRVRRGGRGRDGTVPELRLRLLRAVLVRPRDGVVGGRSVLEQRFAVHHLRRRPQLVSASKSSATQKGIQTKLLGSGRA